MALEFNIASTMRTLPLEFTAMARLLQECADEEREASIADAKRVDGTLRAIVSELLPVAGLLLPPPLHANKPNATIIQTTAHKSFPALFLILLQVKWPGPLGQLVGAHGVRQNQCGAESPPAGGRFRVPGSPDA